MAETITEYNEERTGAEREIVDALRAIIDAALPEAESKVWHRSPVWFLDGNPVTGYAVRKEGVALLFWSGQSFDEPGLTASGSFKMAEKRYLAASEIDAEEVARWVGKSRDIQWDYKNIIKRKGELIRIV